MTRTILPAARAALAVALLGLVPAARAGVLLQPTAASTTMGSIGGTAPSSVRNQSGLSAGYTSGVTDFDAYLAGNPTHANNDANTWGSASGTTTGNFDFALGGTFTIESFALWNIGRNIVSNVRGFELLADDDAAFSSPTSLGTFTANPNTGPLNAVLPEVFTFAPTAAAFVRMRITSNNGGSNTGFGEAAFEAQSSPAAVPEPGSLALLGVGGLGLLAYTRCRRKATLTALTLALLLILAPAARAGVILQPASASTNMGSAGGGISPNNARNQFGLSAGYTSGVTDFDAYLAGNPTHDITSGGGSSVWASAAGTTTGNFDLDLGGTFTIESFALWNSGGDVGFNVRGFELLADDNAAFSSPTSLGTFDANPNTGIPSAVLPEVFTFSPTSAAFVRLRITSNNGDAFTAFGEAAFEVQSPTAVPEPGALALLAAGSLGLLAYARRQKRQPV